MSWTRKKTSLAVSAALAGTSASIADAQIEEIIVTATKRAESAQDVPISVVAVTGDDLRDLRVETFDQYVEYLPNVVATGNGPGKKELYICGSATEQSGVTVAPAQGSAPGVALYVDEQPVSFGARNLDFYAVDAYLNVPLSDRSALPTTSTTTGTCWCSTRRRPSKPRDRSSPSPISPRTHPPSSRPSTTATSSA